MHQELTLEQTLKAWHGSVRYYVIGFVGSLLLTLVSFSLVAFDLIAVELLPFVLAALALVQAAVQLKFFLHLGAQSKPKWETLIFWSMITTLFIIVAGSLWIMSDLNQRTMPPELMEHIHD
jgi:cytochrome o ubiquinol oxidase operon protein cyoD